MEEGAIPQDPKRRWILSTIFNIPPAIMGLKAVPSPKLPRSARRTAPVDIKEFQNALHSYWTQGYQGQPAAALVDLEYRINSLHDHVLYVRSPEKDQMMRLLCGFHMRRAEIARELGYDKTALDHVNKALILAKDNNYLDLAATAFYRRGEMAFDKWKLQSALSDFQAAISLKTIPPQAKGRSLHVAGFTLARLSLSKNDMKEAISMMDEATPYIGATKSDCAISLTGEEYYRFRAMALVSPAERILHMPDAAEDSLTEMLKHSTPELKRFHGYQLIGQNLVQAIIYIDKGYYPIATTLVQEALTIMKQIQSTVHIPTANRIYAQLQASSYGKSTEVAELGLQLLFLQIPQMFTT